MGFKPQQYICLPHTVLSHQPSFLFSVLLSLLISTQHVGRALQLSGREWSSKGKTLGFCPSTATPHPQLPGPYMIKKAPPHHLI